MDGVMEGWRDGGMEGWRDAGMQGWRGGEMEGSVYFKFPQFFLPTLPRCSFYSYPSICLVQNGWNFNEIVFSLIFFALTRSFCPSRSDRLNGVDDV